MPIPPPKYHQPCVSCPRRAVNRRGGRPCTSGRRPPTASPPGLEERPSDDDACSDRCNHLCVILGAFDEVLVQQIRGHDARDHGSRHARARVGHVPRIHQVVHRRLHGGLEDQGLRQQVSMAESVASESMKISFPVRRPVVLLEHDLLAESANLGLHTIQHVVQYTPPHFLRVRPIQRVGNRNQDEQGLAPLRSHIRVSFRGGRHVERRLVVHLVVLEGISEVVVEVLVEEESVVNDVDGSVHTQVVE
mmetsp:Transcript_57403/g.132287  ORF Transcript_57403/g.132287 Transcript_57403/m.132287 type:complete len:248 (+) Transcript_57403:315-1058(+)